jgi:hypothetical protein
MNNKYLKDFRMLIHYTKRIRTKNNNFFRKSYNNFYVTAHRQPKISKQSTHITNRYKWIPIHLENIFLFLLAETSLSLLIYS